MIDYLLWLASRWTLVLLEPIGLVWLALIALTFGLLWRRRLRTAAIVGALALFIFVIGGSNLPLALVRALERPYMDVKAEALPACDAVVLLGGAFDPSRHEVAGLHLTAAGDRIVMALELVRLGKAPVLCIGGSRVWEDGEEKIESESVKNALTLRHLTGAEIVALAPCNDTHDEALRVQALAASRGWRRVLLVTSARHMRRAAATFRTAGVEVVPAACNFMTDPSEPAQLFRFRPPGYAGFELIALWMHEQIGWLEYRRRGWIAR